MTQIPEIFGSRVFGDSVQQKRLPHDTYKKLKAVIQSGEPLDPALADVVANVMKAWAIEQGATHFTHWFQPMTGATAEKHDSFLSPSGDGVIMVFSGKELVRGEPDASSFPSGGIRSTFEARGYTAWDPTSPAFIKDDCLYIPTAFCSYTGEALDKKTPLLRSMAVLEREALRLLHLAGMPEVTSVTPTVGAEQEYFLIPEELFKQRPDLRYTGRTLFGARPPRGQEMEGHYFGSIQPRVAAFMKDLDEELWALGVMAKTEHKETAPSQLELAPVYTTANIAADHNQLTMELMQRVAARHGFACLLQEKPFQHVSGSGKHNNWSLVTDSGENLLKAGSHPERKLPFQLLVSAVLTAVDRYQDLLRETVATAGNDYRLGAAEAPPAILSVYLGEDMVRVLEATAAGEKFKNENAREMEMRVPVMPRFKRDTADRNRTSPMAFTGDKFEFRMVGSSLSVSDPNTILNVSVAEALSEMADRLEKAEDREQEIRAIIGDTLREHGRILFHGDGYSAEWEEEAEKRGLCHLRTAPEAYRCLTEPKNIALLERFGILTGHELRSRQEIHFESYARTLLTEGRTMAAMARQHILPAGEAALRELGETARMKLEISPRLSCRLEEMRGTEISNLCDLLFAGITVLEQKLAAFPAEKGGEEQAFYARDQLLPAMRELRASADRLETLCPAALWPFPTYSELLYSL